MKREKPHPVKSRPVKVLSGPVTHWGATETTALAHKVTRAKAVDIVVHNPSGLCTARSSDLAEGKGTTIILRLSRRQIASWLEELR